MNRPATPTASTAATASRPTSADATPGTSATPATPPRERLGERLGQLQQSLAVLGACGDELEQWGGALAGVFRSGGKLLVAGNGGSAALAAHLTAELVGRFDRDRRAYPAIWLGADQAALTALVNDYGSDHVFARQVEAFARRGDVVLLLSTSGRSPNLVHAAHAAARADASCWALTGPRPNPLADLADRCLGVPGSTAIVQEVHQVAVHLLCEQLEWSLEQPATARSMFAPLVTPAGDR